MMQNCFMYERSKIRKISYLFLYCFCPALLQNSIGFFNFDQAVLWTIPALCMSVCDTLFTMIISSYHHDIFRSIHYSRRWWPCKRSRSVVVNVKYVKIHFCPNIDISGSISNLNSQLATKWRTTLEGAFSNAIHNSSRSHGQKIQPFSCNLRKIIRPVTVIKSVKLAPLISKVIRQLSRSRVARIER